MSKRLVVHPYRMVSRGGRNLANYLKSLRVWPDRNYRIREGDTIINWGNSKYPQWFKAGTTVLNQYENVAIACNKLRTFDVLKAAGINIPEFTTVMACAVEWAAHGIPFMGRELLSSHSGRGCIYVAPDGESSDFSKCKLYSKFIPDSTEWRVYVVGGKVIDVQQKRRRNKTTQNEHIRSHRNGWVFCRKNLEYDEKSLHGIAISAVYALGLDFGAVDILRDDEGKWYVLEINTAPGIADQSAVTMGDAIRELAHGA